MITSPMSLALELVERGWLPDAAVRAGIRRLLAQRLHSEAAGGAATQTALHEQMRRSAETVAADEANRQHYEVPAGFFQRVLGASLKYSCGYWPPGVSSLDDAERAMLALTCERAGVSDGMRILDLGCGWGALTLWLAQRYRAATIHAVSNSRSQRAFIEARCRELSLTNVTVQTADIATCDLRQRFDRILSIEMFEHVRNHERLIRRVASWLNPSGRLFVHVFCHRRWSYFFEPHDPSDWMARHFFTGGMMPSADLVPRARGALRLASQWEVNGTHYRRTALAWLANLDRAQTELLGILGTGSDGRSARRALRRWRLFFMACAELFGYRGGEEWFVSHYLFESTASETAVV